MLFTTRFRSLTENARFFAVLGCLAWVAFSAAPSFAATQTVPHAKSTAKPTAKQVKAARAAKAAAKVAAEAKAAEAQAAAEAAEVATWKNGNFPIHAVVPQVSWKGEAIAADQWKPDAQPNLAQELKNAKPLTFVNVAPGPQMVNSDHRPYMVPNADGTWDMVFPYFGNYFSTQQMVIHDFGTGQTHSEFLGTHKGDTLLTRGRWGFHMKPGFYTHGKLVLMSGGDRPVMFAVYDPEQNKFTQSYKSFGEKVKRGRTALGDDGLIYGIGWDKKKTGFVAYRFDVVTGKAERSKVFGPANEHLHSLYGGITVSGDWVYADFGRQPWRLVGYNFKTGQGRVLATSQPIIGSYKTITYAPIQGGLAGRIQNPATINNGQKVADQTKTLAFWVHDGKLIPRTDKDKNTPWSGKPAVRITQPRFKWARSNQHWPKDFKPQEMTLKQLTANSPDVAVMASDAKLSVKDASKPGWKKIEGEKTYGGVALQNNGSPDRKASGNGVATVTVTFSEPGKYYLYFRGRNQGGRTNAGMAFSRGDKDTDKDTKDASPFSSTTVDNYTRILSRYTWRRASQSLHNGKSFVYNVKKEEVGKPLAFKVATGYTGSDKKFPGMAWDALLFSKKPNKVTSQVPLISRDGDQIDLNGHAKLTYQYQNGPTQTVDYDLIMRNSAMKMVLEVNDHVLFALANQYGQQVFYNLKTKQVMRFKSASSPYSMGLANGKLYVSGYPGSQMFEYAFADKDGKTLARPVRTRVAQIDRKDESHAPIAGTVGGADGNVYNAGITYGRRRKGGGFGWYEPKTGKIGGMPLPERLFWATNADNARYIIFSGKPGATKEYHQLLGWDTKTHQFAYKQYVPDFGSAGPLTEALPGGLVMGHASAREHGYLYGLNAATGKILWLKEVPNRPDTAFALVRRHRYTFRRGPEGDIWTFLGNTLVRIDPRTAHVTVVGQLPAGQKPAQIAFAQGNVYIAWGGVLRQIKDLHTGQVQTAGNTTDKGPGQ